MSHNFGSWSIRFIMVAEEKMSRKEANMVGVILVCAMIGIAMATIVQILNTHDILIPMLIYGSALTLEHLMFIVFFMWLLIGVILGVTVVE